MNRYVVIVSILIGLIVGAWLGSWWTTKSLPAPKPPTIDTLYISIPAKPETVLVKAYLTKLKHDTVFADSSHGEIGLDMAHTLQAFKDHGDVDVTYYFPPINIFKILFLPYPREDKVITKTIYVPQYIEKTSWYNDPWLNRGLGFGFGIGAAIWIHKGLK
jgi:hypothetical protein